jgi:hypothetical protein
MPVEGLRLTDIIASAKEGLRAFNTKGLELHNVRIDAEGGIPFLIRDSVSLDLDGVQTRTPKPDMPVIRLDRSKVVTIRNIVPWPGAGAVLSLAPGMKGDITIAPGVSVKEEESDAWKSINTPDRPRR